MTRQALQVYLTPDQHQILSDEARRSGRSMTEVIRQLIDKHLRGAAAPPTDFSDLVGAAHIGKPINVAEDKDRMIREAVGDLYRRKRALR
jgi:hypothetical protein